MDLFPGLKKKQKKPPLIGPGEKTLPLSQGPWIQLPPNPPLALWPFPPPLCWGSELCPALRRGGPGKMAGGMGTRGSWCERWGVGAHCFYSSPIDSIFNLEAAAQPFSSTSLGKKRPWDRTSLYSLSLSARKNFLTSEESGIVEQSEKWNYGCFPQNVFIGVILFLQ